MPPKLELQQENRILGLNGSYDSSFQFEFYYEDEDGDIGLRDSDTAGAFVFGGPYFYNFFCNVFQKQQGQWVSVPNPFTQNEPLHFNERFPYLTPSGKDKRLTGTFTLFIPARPLGLKLDTVYFEMYLVDRALQKSNICKSKEFVLKHP